MGDAEPPINSADHENKSTSGSEYKKKRLILLPLLAQERESTVHLMNPLVQAIHLQVGKSKRYNGEMKKTTELILMLPLYHIMLATPYALLPLALQQPTLAALALIAVTETILNLKNTTNVTLEPKNATCTRI